MSMGIGNGRHGGGGGEHKTRDSSAWDIMHQDYGVQRREGGSQGTGQRTTKDKEQDGRKWASLTKDYLFAYALSTISQLSGSMT